MQYGNKKLSDFEAEKKESLNRTMQYGNVFLVTFFPKKSNSLNRTMQYGNIVENIVWS